MLVSTEPVITTVTSPDKSVAVAPISVYEPPNSQNLKSDPLSVTTGAVVSTTFTVLVAEAVLPEASVAV